MAYWTEDFAGDPNSRPRGLAEELERRFWMPENRPRQVPRRFDARDIPALREMREQGLARAQVFIDQIEDQGWIEIWLERLNRTY